MKQNLKWFFQSVSIKLLDFFLSFSLQFFKFVSSLKQNGWPELSYFHTLRFQLFIWISCNRNSIKIMPLQQEHLFSIISWYLIYYWYLNTSLLFCTYSSPFLGLESPRMYDRCIKKIQLEDGSCVYVFLHPDIIRKFAGLE